MTLAPADRTALDALASDLQRLFGARLHSIVAYGLDGRAVQTPRVLHSLVLVERLTFEDLMACVPLTSGWRARRLAVPLILPREEFLRTLDVFPLEYGDIIADHVVVSGRDPFAGVSVAEADFRRAIELQAKSHLIHLREGLLETQGRSETIAQLIAASVPVYQSLLRNIERLEMTDGDATAHTQPSHRLLQELAGGSAIADPTALLERYLADAERIWRTVDGWRR
jgi:hypothetical protein